MNRSETRDTLRGRTEPPHVMVIGREAGPLEEGVASFVNGPASCCRCCGRKEFSMGVMGLLPLWCGCKWVRWMGVESFEGRWSCFLRAVPVSHVMRRSVAITAAARGCFFLVLVLVLVTGGK